MKPRRAGDHFVGRVASERIVSHWVTPVCGNDIRIRLQSGALAPQHLRQGVGVQVVGDLAEHQQIEGTGWPLRVDG